MKTNFSRQFQIGVMALMACTCALNGCSFTNSRSTPSSSNQELEQVRQQLALYRKRFGPLTATNPRHNLRDLQKTLPGKSMKEVAALLGKPGGVYLSGQRECWDYYGICYAPITGRAVEKLGIWFEKGKVERLDSVF